MPTAYTPGLTVTGDTRIRKVRRLPMKGQVLVEAGQHVQAETVVARAELPGPLTNIKASEKLGIEPNELPSAMRVSVGDRVERDQLLAELKSFFGIFHNELRSPVEGVIEHISELSGYVGIRQPSVPINTDAYISGVIEEVLPEQGAVITARGAFIEGIFGVGGERRGMLKVLAASPDVHLSATQLSDDLRGMLIVGGAGADAAALQRAAKVGVAGVIVGAVTDSDLRALVGYDIGVAITGHEDIPMTLILTEGFGTLPISQHTFELLQSLDGKQASFNGATQIRAGVIRPEIIVPRDGDDGPAPERAEVVGTELVIGSRVRVIREPYFGQLSKVTALPPELQEIATGAKVRVAELMLDSGERTVVPRANLEILRD